ncbi:5-hydroxytryptamine receptor 3A [Anabarilius grahami]|uniref:5-hydroxytryptamine receptor 3A n=1 Tax=Anabarilius grahami TaxID=495550 RepID=A0A3N0YIL6_ANAGA|nr:5-hydroxytryptamine receptor 3A [Anabarilius grahami]
MWPLIFNDNPDDIEYFNPAYISVDLYVTSIINVVIMGCQTVTVSSLNTYFYLQDEKAQSLTTQVRMITAWPNSNMTWNPKDYCGIDIFATPKNNVWTPDIGIMESIKTEFGTKESPNVQLYFDGLTVSTDIFALTTACKMDLYKFPFDTQSCTITLQSTVYSDLEIILQTVYESARLTNKSKELFQAQGEWELLDIQNKNVSTDDDLELFKKHQLIYQIIIKRRPLLYVINIIVPVFFFLVLDVISFFIDTSGSDKISFKVTLLLSISVMLLLVNDTLPSTAENIPLIGMLQGGMRTADVARAINCHVRTVRRLRQRYRETGRTADHPRSERPRVTTPAQDRYIRISHLRDRYRMATTTARVTPGTHNPSISAQTVRKRLREAGLRACRPVVRQVLTRHHQQQRRLWAQTHLRWTRQEWQKVLFTDESRCCLTRGDGRIRVYRRRNERYTEACTLERDRFGGGGSVMVWGSISHHHRTELVVIAGQCHQPYCSFWLYYGVIFCLIGISMVETIFVNFMMVKGAEKKSVETIATVTGREDSVRDQHNPPDSVRDQNEDQSNNILLNQNLTEVQAATQQNQRQKLSWTRVARIIDVTFLILYIITIIVFMSVLWKLWLS